MSYLFWHLSSGINQWRDQLKPSQILENVARMKGLSKPKTEDNGTSLTFNGIEYTLAEFGNASYLKSNFDRLMVSESSTLLMVRHLVRSRGLMIKQIFLKKSLKSCEKFCEAVLS